MYHQWVFAVFFSVLVNMHRFMQCIQDHAQFKVAKMDNVHIPHSRLCVLVFYRDMTVPWETEYKFIIIVTTNRNTSNMVSVGVPTENTNEHHILISRWIRCCIYSMNQGQIRLFEGKAKSKTSQLLDSWPLLNFLSGKKYAEILRTITILVN